nr:hypothetical protein [Tanacetum cinerariifolium]
MSLDDLYNHLKVYEAEVQKKSNSNSQDMAFISSSKNISNEDGNTICVTTVSTTFPTGSVNVATISQDTASAYISSQSNGSQIKFEDINQIDEDDMEEMDIKWNMALLSMRADKFWKRTGKKISIQGSDVAGFDKSKVECFNCHKMGHFARECRAPRSQERGRKESYRQGSKAEEKSLKELMAIDRVGWDWSYMANEEDLALVVDGEAPTEFALMANIENKVFDNSLCLNECKKNTDSLNSKIKDLKRKFKQLQFRIQQYLQHEHYALWKVIKFGDSYKVPTNTDPDDTTTKRDVEQSGRTVTFITEDMHKKKNDVKARTTLLLSLPDEHQLRFSKYKTAKELWAAFLKTFGEVEKDDLNQKFLTSLAPEWLMHTIVWRNKNDLDSMSLDDLYNNLKVYEAEV